MKFLPIECEALDFEVVFLHVLYRCLNIVRCSTMEHTEDLKKDGDVAMAMGQGKPG